MADNDSKLTQSALKELLHYNPETGVFTWRIRPSIGTKPGSVAGSDMSGYWSIRVQRGRFKAHRLAWLYTHGEFPSGVIDHINGDTHDNRIVNLRDVTKSGNGSNQRAARKDNACGYLGVHKAKGFGWKAQIMINGTTTHLGTHPTPELAYDAYLSAKRKLHSTCTI